MGPEVKVGREEEGQAVLLEIRTGFKCAPFSMELEETLVTFRALLSWSYLLLETLRRLLWSDNKNVIVKNHYKCKHK